jgi:peptide deformylase
MAADFDLTNLSIITYPHPTLRYTAKPVKRVDLQLKKLIARMFELMYEHRGVGLAATQVDVPLRLFVMNAGGAPEEGEERAFINPVISKPQSSDEAEEGCLSLPNIHGVIVRPKTIRFNAYELTGNEVDQELTGFEARVVQHETDHLDGRLFIDRLAEGAELEHAAELDAMVIDFQSRQQTGGIASDEQLLAGLAEWERRYC